MSQVAPLIPEQTVLAFTDVETTGLSTEHHDIIALAIVFAIITAEGLRQVGVFDTYVRPTRPENATEEAMAVNGLSLAELESAPSLQEAMESASAAASEYGRVVFCGHNLQFDMRFIEAAEAATGVRIHRHPSLVIDTMGMVKTHLKDTGKIKSAKLTEVVAHYQIPHQAHVAVSDCVATLAVCDRIREEAPGLFKHHTERAIWAANQLELLAFLDDQRQDAEYQLRLTPEYQALQAAQAAFEAIPLQAEVKAKVAALTERRQAIVKSLETVLDVEEGPIKTADGGVVGFTTEREYTYHPKVVRKLLPAYANKIIKVEEKVQFGIMQSFAKAAVKAGEAPADVLEQIRAQADVKVTKKWACKPGQVGDREAAAARLAALELAEAPVTAEGAADYVLEAPDEADDALRGPDVVVSAAAPRAAAMNQAWNDLEANVPLPALPTLARPTEDDDLVAAVVPAAGGSHQLAQAFRSIEDDHAGSGDDPFGDNGAQFH